MFLHFETVFGHTNREQITPPIKTRGVVRVTSVETEALFKRGLQRIKIGIEFDGDNHIDRDRIAFFEFKFERFRLTTTAVATILCHTNHTAKFILGFDFFTNPRFAELLAFRVQFSPLHRTQRTVRIMQHLVFETTKAWLTTICSRSRDRLPFKHARHILTLVTRTIVIVVVIVVDCILMTRRATSVRSTISTIQQFLFALHQQLKIL
mmetsp:Transcript_56022/g.93347  ORF Transcript_56022/g.93347 Transcript_56022/m.93347 type:complete len:208 (+) Transcript_56022:1264-1887(+)